MDLKTIKKEIIRWLPNVKPEVEPGLMKWIKQIYRLKCEDFRFPISLHIFSTKI